TRSQLESLGLEPHVASNGRQVLDRAAELGPDVILMDGQMPEMDGYAAARAIRDAEGDGPRVVIVGLTAHATADARDRCLDAGMDDYLAKPVRVSDLAERLAHWFPATGGDRS
ncbi:MAG: response regulator, partial [Acidobacteriota bacterium]